MTITISIAIQVLEEDHRYHSEGKDPGTATALKLGIEALKEAQRWRAGQPLHLPNLLPGETPEEEVE